MKSLENLQQAASTARIVVAVLADWFVVAVAVAVVDLVAGVRHNKRRKRRRKKRRKKKRSLRTTS